jgi:AcrR family transcriptional regulator
MDDPGAGPAKSTSVDARQREEFSRAVLALSGELGFAAVSAEQIAAAAGLSVDRFYAQFATREECFVVAYESESAPLLARMLAAGEAAPSWPESVRAALGELFAFANDRPGIARAVLSEVYVAGGSALERHQEVLERLSQVIADPCRETHPSRHSPPPSTAVFMVGGIDQSVRWRLGQGHPELLWPALPELTALLIAPYLGDEAAAAERRRPARPPGDDS